MTVPHPLMRQLAAARQQAGLSLDEWSARLGMQLSTVSYLERGISSLSLAALERLAGDLGYEVVLQPTAPAQTTAPVTGSTESSPAAAARTGGLSGPRIPVSDDEPWTADGPYLRRDGRVIATWFAWDSDSETAEWIAHACNVLAAMEQADAEYEASGEAPHCHVIEVDGEPVRVQADVVTEELRTAITDLTRAVRANHDGTNDLDALRDRIAAALTAEHYRRAHEQIVAPVEEHQAAFAAVVVDAIRPELDRLERHRHQAENRAQLFRDQAAAEHERAEQAERDRDTLKRDIIDASEQNHQFKGEIDRLTTLLAQYADRGIANGQRADRYRTAWWSARTRATKSHAAYIDFHDLLTEATETLNRVRELHSRHECDDCNCRLCWGLLPVCSAGCAEYPCPTIRALDAEHTRPCPRCGTPALLPGEADLCPPCETALHRAAPDEPGPDRTTPDQNGHGQPCNGCETCELATELADARAAIDRVRRLCELTINASCRVQAIEQARDTLAVLDRAEPDATGSAQ